MYQRTHKFTRTVTLQCTCIILSLSFSLTHNTFYHVMNIELNDVASMFIVHIIYNGWQVYECEENEKKN